MKAKAPNQFLVGSELKAKGRKAGESLSGLGPRFLLSLAKGGDGGREMPAAGRVFEDWVWQGELELGNDSRVKGWGRSRLEAWGCFETAGLCTDAF